MGYGESHLWGYDPVLGRSRENTLEENLAAQRRISGEASRAAAEARLAEQRARAEAVSDAGVVEQIERSFHFVCRRCGHRAETDIACDLCGHEMEHTISP